MQGTAKPALDYRVVYCSRLDDSLLVVPLVSGLNQERMALRRGVLLGSLEPSKGVYPSLLRIEEGPCKRSLTARVGENPIHHRLQEEE
jgi:hypothetical protein